VITLFRLIGIDLPWPFGRGGKMATQSAQGLDVSNYQGKFAWSTTTGLSFGIYRLTQGMGEAGTNSPDPDAQWNHDQIKAKGLIHGAYHFFDPKLSGSAQAEYFVAQHSLVGLDDSDMLWLDNETANGVSPADVSASALAFMTELDKLRPNNPRGVYTFINFATGGNCAGLQKWPLWLAYPAAKAPATPPPWSKWTFWQWGLRNATDADAFNGTAAELHAWVASYAKQTPKPYEAPANTSMRTLAQQHGRDVAEVVWLTARNRPQGFGPMERAYITAGNWDAAMPVGMTVWA
jgi:lysozyme